MKLATLLQDKLDEVYYENIIEDSIWKKYKAYTAAFLSGVIDGCIIGYPFMLVSCMIASYCLKNNQE